ncbi:hypothetical protein FJY71_07890, partial [candidate division WOR-3 bacterium]|nr:hypothetical protein [candidate division WOR-3 bacterium]
MSCRLMKAGLGIGLALAAVASAEVPLRDYAGREVGWHDARGLAAGGLGGLFPGPGAAFANPAVLGFLTRPAVTLGYGMEVASEERTRIVYDRFENTLAEAGIADNTSAHGLAGPAVGAVRLGPVGIGAGVAPVRAFGYSYLKEYRDDFYVKFGEDRVEQSGAVYAANLGLGFSPFGPLSAGARAGYLFGTRRLEVEAWRGPDTSRYVEEGNPSGIGYAAGLAVRPARMLCVGLDYEGGVTYSSWLTGDALPPEAVTDRSFPWAGRLALAWQIPGPLPAVADAELRYLAWHAVDSTCGNILLARAGVEHLMLN